MRLFLMEGVRWAFKSEAWKPTKQEWLKGLSCVQSEEKERVQKFVFKKDVKSSLIGRLLLRKVITEMLNIPYNEINLGRTEKGKPFLLCMRGHMNIDTTQTKNLIMKGMTCGLKLGNIRPKVNEIENSRGKSFSFNVSHQGDYTVLAAEPHRQAGVDIMKTTYPGGTDVPGFFHIMRKQFTPHEWTTVKNLSNEWEQLQMFYRFWCLKESYVKAVGVGIGHDLQATEFRIKTQELSRESITCDSCLHLNGSKNKEWSFEEIKLDNLHQVAVALGPLSTDGETMSSQRSSPIPFKFLSFDEVISSATPLRPIEEESWESFKTKRENPAR